MRLSVAGSKPDCPVAEPRIERAVESIDREAKWQARNFDPGMVAVKAVAVAGERKAVTSIRPRLGESLQRAWKL